MISQHLKSQKVKNAIENALSKDVEIKMIVPNAVRDNEKISISNFVVSKEIFEQAKASQKNVSFMVETQDGKAIMKFTFEGEKITELVDTNLAVAISRNENNKVRVSFSHT